MTLAISKVATGRYTVSAYCYNDTVKYTTRRLQNTTTTVFDPAYLTVYFIITTEVEKEARVVVDTVAMLISNRTILEDAIEVFDTQQEYGQNVVIVRGSDPVLSSSDSEATDTTGMSAYIRINNSTAHSLAVSDQNRL
jgi:hypothetical protein